MQPCGGSYFCPGEVVSREEMAIFLERGIRGATFVPATPTVPPTPPFEDVARTYGLDPWIEKLWRDEVTLGVDATHYAPNNGVLRQEMAAFISRAYIVKRDNLPEFASPTPDSLIPTTLENFTAYGQEYTYNCVSGGTSIFQDVQPTDWFCPAVHFLFSKEITTGCQLPGTPLRYCPNDYVLRDQMSAFMKRAFIGSDTQ